MDTTQQLNRDIEILLIEDNPADARLVSLALKGLGHPYRLKVVSNGVEALDFLKKRDQYFYATLPDFILLDWRLPGVDGREILRQIRQDRDLTDIPVAVLSGLDADEMLTEAYVAGANVFVDKPVNLESFSRGLRQITETVILKKFPGQE